MGSLSIIGATPNPVREGTSSAVTVQVRYTPDPVNDGFGLRDFTYRTVEGTATKDDFVGFGDSKVTFSTDDTIPGLTRQEDFFFTIPINDDAIVENQESFVFELATVNGAVADQNQRIVIDILDNDSPDQPTPLGRGTIRFEFANYVVIEGQSFIEARVIREGGQTGVIQGAVAVELGTAAATDFTDPGQTSIFFGDQDITPKIIRVPISNDTLPEVTESFTLVLTENRTGTNQNTTEATNLVVDRSVVEIQDNDGLNNILPTAALSQSIINVAENAGFVEVPLDIIFPDGVPPAPANADYTLTVTAGNATSGDDFVAVAARTFNFGGANQSFRDVIRIPINNDAIPEGTETLSVNLTNNGSFRGNPVTIVNIIDDDVAATVTISPPSTSSVTANSSVNEGDRAVITVTPNGTFEQGEVRTVTINTQDVLARLGQDFTALNFGTLTFSFDNPSPQSATINILADQISEQDETFQVVTSGTRTINDVTVPLRINGGNQTVTITETPSIRVVSVTPIVTEGLDRFAQVRVERLGDVSGDISATLATRAGSAVDGTDYVGLSNQIVRFAPGDSSPRIFNIPIIDNDAIQLARTLTVELTNPLDSTPVPQVLLIPASISADGTPIPATFGPDPTFIQPPAPSLGTPATITINDNDGPNSAGGTAAARGSIQFEFANFVINEDRPFLDIRVQRIGGTSGTISGEIALGTATGSGVANAGTDFIAPAQTSVFFADGVGGSQTIRVPIINDVLSEPTETFSLNLTETRGEQTLTVNSTVVQITDNDGDNARNFGTIGFGNTAILNVNEGAGLVNVPIFFSGAASPGQEITINYTISTGDGIGAATEDEDFIGIEDAEIIFTAGISAIQIPVTVPIIDDRTIELSEVFSITIESLEGALFGGSSRLIVNIIDNDGQGDGNTPASDTLESPFFSPITPTDRTAPFLTPEAVNPPAIPTDNSDSLIGTNGSESLFGQKGNDTIDGRDGSDTLFGGDDQDILIGGAGVDQISGNSGDDQINAGTGDDLLFGGRGSDSLFGGAGNDFLSGDAGNDILLGDAGQDRFAVQVIEGVDFVSDFVVGTDFLALTGGLQFSQLAIVQSGLNTIVRFASNGQDLLVLSNVTARDVTSSSFVSG